MIGGPEDYWWLQDFRRKILSWAEAEGIEFYYTDCILGEVQRSCLHALAVKGRLQSRAIRPSFPGANATTAPPFLADPAISAHRAVQTVRNGE